MTAWTPRELGRIGQAAELQLASVRSDGTLRPYVTMWVVRAGDDLYVRSVYGPDNPWFRRAKSSGVGRIRAGGVERDVSFAEPVPGVHGDIDAAFEAKYDRYGPEIVGTVVGRKAEEVTIRLMPRSSERSDDSVGGGGPGVLMKRLAHNRRSGAEATLLARIDCGSRVLRAVDVHVA